MPDTMKAPTAGFSRNVQRDKLASLSQRHGLGEKLVTGISSSSPEFHWLAQAEYLWPVYLKLCLEIEKSTELTPLLLDPLRKLISMRFLFDCQLSLRARENFKSRIDTRLNCLKWTLSEMKMDGLSQEEIVTDLKVKASCFMILNDLKDQYLRWEAKLDPRGTSAFNIVLLHIRTALEIQNVIKPVNVLADAIEKSGFGKHKNLNWKKGTIDNRITHANKFIASIHKYGANMDHTHMFINPRLEEWVLGCQLHQKCEICGEAYRKALGIKKYQVTHARSYPRKTLAKKFPILAELINRTDEYLEILLSEPPNKQESAAEAVWQEVVQAPVRSICNDPNIKFI